jgi:hypothetical protein
MVGRTPADVPDDVVVHGASFARAAPAQPADGEIRAAALLASHRH